MEIEKAIISLKCAVLNVTEHRQQFNISLIGCDRLNNALDTAIEALEKQAGKKPTGEYEDEPMCPSCLEVIDGCNVGIIKHCPDCGQRIDWGDEQ